MDFLAFVLVSALVIITLVLLLRRRFKKLESGGDVSLPSLFAPDRIYQTVKWYFIIVGAGLIINGFIHTLGLLSGVITKIQIFDAIFNAGLGIIYLFCVWLYTKRNKIVIWIFGFAVLLSIGYPFAVGRGFNFPIVIIGSIVMYQLLQLVKTNELHFRS